MSSGHRFFVARCGHALVEATGVPGLDEPAEIWITPSARSSGGALLSRAHNGLWLSDLTAIPATLRIGRPADHNRVVTTEVALAVGV